jgi:GNAT superfamily N-acetyltransferase
LLDREDPAIADLLVRALPYDRVAVVYAEKLFGSDGARRGRAVGAFAGGQLVGVLAQAERFVKILAVDPARRQAGIGSLLIDDALAHGATRIGDHPGNYLSPGVDLRYADGIAFLRKRGFVERERVENLRAPIDGNALVAPARAAALAEDAAQLGYRIARASEGELPGVLDFIASAFAKVWAHEAERAHRGPCRALFVAFAGETPVAFAAADGNNRGLGWFGPAGTSPAHRGKKLGEAVLVACIDAVRALPEAGVIAWVGPKPFYARAIGAVDDRSFVQLEKRS